MSNLERDPSAAVVTVDSADLITGREVALGRYTTVRRYLPHRGRRTVGAWCFLDLFGPDSVIDLPGMRVPPHPHIGLQTVTWLLDGEILHRDSIGSVRTVRPGQLNLMTSGRGIAHAEESPTDRPPTLHGLQLWIALPDGARHGEPRFAHHADLPVVERSGLRATVLVGELAGTRSPATVHTPLVGADLALAAGADTGLPMRPDWEYALLLVEGSAALDGAALAPGTLRCLEYGRSGLGLSAETDARLFLIGGEPFDEALVMWWNFVGRSHEEIEAARSEWETGGRFGTVHGYAGDPLAAPPLPNTRLKARDRHGRSG